MGEVKVNRIERASNHDARKIRKNGNISCNLYGEFTRKYLYEISEMDFNQELSINKNGVMDFLVDGVNEKVLIREIQKDPVTRKIIHIDAQRVDKNKVVECNVQVNFTGEENLTRKGLMFQRNQDNLKVKCKVSEKPEKAIINVSNNNVGDVIRACDVEFSNEISIVSDLDMVLGSIGKLKSSFVEEEKEIEEE